MANRIIREGINDSKKVNELGFEAEVFYRRLFAIADDYGYFEADLDLLRANLYKRLLDTVTVDLIEQWMQKCIQVGLIDAYEQRGMQYGQILNFKQSLRKMQSRYPTQDGNFVTKDEFKESQTENQNLIEFYFKDFPNSTHLEGVAKAINVPKETLIKALPEFKKAANLSYPNTIRFAEHFKNWYLKKGNSGSGANTTTGVKFKK